MVVTDTVEVEEEPRRAQEYKNRGARPRVVSEFWARSLFWELARDIRPVSSLSELGDDF